MQSSITLDDVISSAKKYGENKVLTHDLKKVRDLKTLNPKSPYDTTYIPLLFRHINGKNMKVKIEFSEQLISSGAKKPQGNEEEKDVPKYMSIAFSSMPRENIEGGDYVPKEKDDDKDQDKENKRLATNIDRYMENTSKFLRVLDIIDVSYKQVCEDLTNATDLKFKIKKDRKQTDITIYSIKQSTRIDKDTDKDEVLENPIYRIRIPVCKKDETDGKVGKIGIWSNYHKNFKHTVFDARKMTKKTNYLAVPLCSEVDVDSSTVKKLKKRKVKVYSRLVDGKKQYYTLEELTVDNASSVITYKSLVGGTISFECITSSKFGLSMSANFYDLYVFRHKTREVQNNSKDVTLKLRGCVEDEDEDQDQDEEDSDDVKDTKEDSDSEDSEEDPNEEESDDGKDPNNESNDAEPVDSDEEPDEDVEKLEEEPEEEIKVNKPKKVSKK
jgi:hypothetical protein